jgi:hypothetical protein
MTTIGKFIEAVLYIGNNREAAQAFYAKEIGWLREHHPEVTDPDAVLRSNIGWCFGEGMPVATRKMWRDATGAVHPGFGPEYAERDFTPDECLRAGMAVAKREIRERTYPSAWDLVLGERFGD